MIFFIYSLGWYVINRQHHHYIDKYIHVKSFLFKSLLIFFVQLIIPRILKILEIDTVEGNSQNFETFGSGCDAYKTGSD